MASFFMVTILVYTTPGSRGYVFLQINRLNDDFSEIHIPGADRPFFCLRAGRKGAYYTGE